MKNEYTRAGILLNAIRAPYEFFSRLCENYEPDEILKGASFWEELGLKKNHQQKLSGLLRDNWAEKEIDRAEKFGARFITAKDIDYPAKLKDLKNPPVGLYVKGSANILLPSVAIVGTRKCSSYGQTTATNIAKALAQNHITVISGGARGIDTAGHRGCLSENGATIAVFGTGIDKVYPIENRDLFSRIIERGAIISEFPMGMGGESWHFPDRNRIIVGMASRVVVVESPEGGGAMLTARAALELGREVWSVPGKITDDVSKGTNQLFNEGAKTTVSVKDFIEIIAGTNEQFNLNFDEFSDAPQKIKKAAPILTDEEKIIYSILQRQGEILIDEIISKSGLDFMTVQEALMNLSAEGLIMDSSGRYSATA
ncbi:MAG: DNA-processing protein DprA [Synergistaceae bacterium]|nr:DNA-processing protein DprA [Synergistaceae bacterium]